MKTTFKIENIYALELEQAIELFEITAKFTITEGDFLTKFTTNYISEDEEQQMNILIDNIQSK